MGLSPARQANMHRCIWDSKLDVNKRRKRTGRLCGEDVKGEGRRHTSKIAAKTRKNEGVF
jgi:hypothetical protein